MTERVGFTCCTAARHQGEIKAFWLLLWRALRSSMFLICSHNFLPAEHRCFLGNVLPLIRGVKSRTKNLRGLCDFGQSRGYLWLALCWSKINHRSIIWSYIHSRPDAPSGSSVGSARHHETGINISLCDTLLHDQPRVLAFTHRSLWILNNWWNEINIWWGRLEKFVTDILNLQI